jgi:hypothetical protein
MAKLVKSTMTAWFLNTSNHRRTWNDVTGNEISRDRKNMWVF